MRNFIATIILFTYIILPSQASIEPSKLDMLVKLIGIDIPVVIEPIDELNAYTEGVMIHIYQGLLNMPEANPEAVELVLLHEYGHYKYHHIEQTKLLNYMYDLERDLCSGNTQCIKKAYYEYTEGLRRLETDADSYAYQRAKELGLSTDACEIFHGFAKEEAQYGDIDEREVDHPLSSKRYKKCTQALSRPSIVLSPSSSSPLFTPLQ